MEIEAVGTNNVNGVAPTKRKAQLACQECRKAKTRCDEHRPCGSCWKKGLSCKYDLFIKRRGPGKQPLNNKSQPIAKGNTNIPPNAVISSIADACDAVGEPRALSESLETPLLSLGVNRLPPIQFRRLQEDAAAETLPSFAQLMEQLKVPTQSE
ncbi:hypothetical protein SISNIDRAFT_471268 [Sistotremastrum niveocremeum HHB9708]|uniref:Zn(2)-C6 fungal-type domain-containing protein n=1 Tax=Sistotremastrum niveocremeum HHB9708 TaxID=1314777 RepID=A0A164MW20_9AGAM|nr:hypothetical protein SISNIDRAFT_471268 [Sistotremastrum niveocremeum HHB9708]